MDTLFRIHSDLRWLIVVLGIVTVLRLLIGLLGRHGYDRSSRVLVTLFGIAIDIQVALGLIYFIWNGAKYDLWPRERFEHLVIMLVAAFIAHLPRRWRGAPDTIRYRNDLLAVVSALVLIFVGVVVLLGGMDRWQPDF